LRWTRLKASSEARFIHSFNSPLINTIAGRLAQNDEMQGAQILRNEGYNQYAAMT